MGFSSGIIGWDSQVRFSGDLLRWGLIKGKTLDGDSQVAFSGGNLR